MGYKREPKTIEGIEYWQCTKCEQWLPVNAFYTEKRSRFGIKSECKKCHVQTSLESRDQTKSRESNRRWMKESGYSKRPEVKERERARSKRRSRSIAAKSRDILNDAVNNGIIDRPSYCPLCGKNGDVDGHHDSYYRPIEVKWMCPLCHAKYHRELMPKVAENPEEV